MATITSLVTSPAPFADQYPTGQFSVVQFNRPADVLAYGAEDVISDSASVAAAIRFPNVGRNGLLRGASLITSDPQAANYTLLVFSHEPQNYVDNAALSLQAADAAKLVVVYQWTAEKGLGTFSWRQALTTLSPHITYGYCSPDGNLYGLLCTNSVITPVSAATYTIKLSVETL